MAIPILDAHCDTILKVVDDGANIVAPYPGTHIDGIYGAYCLSIHERYSPLFTLSTHPSLSRYH